MTLKCHAKGAVLKVKIGRMRYRYTFENKWLIKIPWDLTIILWGQKSKKAIIEEAEKSAPPIIL